ncbi:hypothetical protein [uncultured Paraglaciecola sp.]|uniref:hypothetical protein n=1 Tax=uncultured Paraglaciecola sp. TaxID=1765024 RepID=UPI00261F7510|nr:hypothetical protein [uncultured Paraglaciecola sp.]
MLQIARLQPPIRNDIAGGGEFLASRGDRLHYGIDYQIAAGSHVLVAKTCEFVKVGQAYGDTPEFKYIEVRDGDVFVRYFYVQPNPALSSGTQLFEAEWIGCAQPIGQHYANGMQDHVHVEVFYTGEKALRIPNGVKFIYRPDKDRTYVDPAAYFRGEIIA